MQFRRNEYDVTDRVNLRKPMSVFTEVSEIMSDYCTDLQTDVVRRAFKDFSLLYRGKYNGYLACDVPYHDLQHVMDVTLTTARLLAGHEREQPGQHQLGPERIMLGIILALYHDCGYIREAQHDKLENGAQYTSCHITRGEQFLSDYLSEIGLGEYVSLVSRLIHYTGYEKPIDKIHIADRRDRVLGFIVGSADLLAQMADRCYLEKCRERLYPEFVLGGLTRRVNELGEEEVLYASAEELLQRTPDFYQNIVRPRLQRTFDGVADYSKVFFDGQDLYQEEIDRNLSYLDVLIAERDFRLLRRKLAETPESRAFPYQRLQNIRSH